LRRRTTLEGQASASALQLPERITLRARQTRTSAWSRSACPTHLRSVSGVHPIFAAIDLLIGSILFNK